MAANMGRIVAYLTLNDAKFVAGMKRTAARMNVLSRRARSTGRAMTTGMSLPLALISGAAVKVAVDFDKSMTKIETLVGRGSKQVAQWREEILEMAPAVGKGPVELADALFFVTSAGVESAKALDVVRNAARAAAVGLGETKTVADAVVSAMAAWKETGLSAAEATDVLVATVRYGKLEASDLASVLGRVTSTAAYLKVSFAEVGAAIATFSRAGANAEIAATALRGALNIFLSPAQKTTDALASIGVSVKLVQDSIEKDGLAVAMVKLVGGFKGNLDALGKFIPNVRALALVLSNAAAQGMDYVQIARKITKSAGMTDSAFKRTTKTFAFQFDVFKAKIGVLAVAFGTQLVPMLLEAVNWIGGYVTKMGAAGAETLVLAAAAVVTGAAIGPLLFSIGLLIKGLSLLITTIYGVWLAVTGLPGLIFLGVVAFIALIVAIFDTEDAWGELLSSIPLIGGVLDHALGYAKHAVKGIGRAILEGVSSILGKMQFLALKMSTILGGRFGSFELADQVIQMKAAVDATVLDMTASINDMWIDIEERSKAKGALIKPFEFDIQDALEDAVGKIDISKIKSLIDGMLITAPDAPLRKNLQSAVSGLSGFFKKLKVDIEDALDTTDAQKFNREVERGIIELTRLHTDLSSAGAGSQKQLQILADALTDGDTSLSAFIDNYTSGMADLEEATKGAGDSIKINLGETFANTMDEMFTGFLRGTRDLESMTEVFSNSMIGIFEDFFSQTIRNKLNFDDVFIGNFMEDLLPAIADFAKQAIGFLGSIFGVPWLGGNYSLGGGDPSGRPAGVSGPVRADDSFHSGGIVTGPTTAQVGDNPSGIEAIIPLERWKEVMGGGGGGINIQIHAPTAVESTKRSRNKSGNDMMEIVFEGAKSAVANDIYSGGVVSQAIGSTFGQRRRGGR